MQNLPFSCYWVSLAVALCLAGPSSAVPLAETVQPAGAWQGDLVPPGWMSASAKVEESRTSVIVFHAYHSAYSEQWFRFDMTTSRPHLIARTDGDYTYHNGVLALHYSGQGERANPTSWLRYKVTFVGGALRLTALNNMNTPPSATLRPVTKEAEKHGARSSIR